jgi:hypothetical protein
MRPVLKILLKIAFDIVATIAFFYLALLTVPYAVGFPAAGIAYLLSFVPNLSTQLGPVADQSFLMGALLNTLGLVYLMLMFAVAIEVVRRLVGSRSIWLYVTGSFITMTVYLGTASIPSGPTKAFALGLPLLMAAGAGAGYWLVTVKLRAILIAVAGRLICGPDAKSCQFS